MRYKEYFLDDAEFVIIGFGTAGRVALSAVRAAREQRDQGWSVADRSRSARSRRKVLENLSDRVQGFLVVEMNTGQMLEDVRLAVQGRVPVEFYGRLGGVVPFPDEILREIQRIVAGKSKHRDSNPRDAWFERMTATS